jgi:adenylyltransferase/sulfurtransferase
MALSAKEIQRYDRHVKLKGFGLEGQQKLQEAKVLVIGAGGLGCPVLQYLVAAGVGTIGLADGDVVSYSNLQRQILFTTEDVGKPKVTSAVEKLRLQNEFVKFEVYQDYLTQDNILPILEPYDLVIDGTDNFETRYLVGDATLILNKPLVFGSIFKFEGQISVFNHDAGPSYRCLFPDPPSSDEVPNCSEVGVIGVLPGVVGAKMANEAIKLITSVGETLSGKLEVIDLLNNRSFYLKVNRVEENFKRTALEEEYAFQCEAPELILEKSMSPVQLKEAIAAGAHFDLIDVREPHEFEICQIAGSKLIPLGFIPERKEEVSKTTPTVLICHHGVRSQRAIEWLANEGYTNLINLTGGIHAWACDVDHEMMKY